MAGTTALRRGTLAVAGPPSQVAPYGAGESSDWKLSSTPRQPQPGCGTGGILAAWKTRRRSRVRKVAEAWWRGSWRSLPMASVRLRTG